MDRAVAAARRAFPGYSLTSREERIALLQRIDDGFKRRREDLAQAMSLEMGVPITAARNVHFPSGPAHLQETISVLKDFAFESLRGDDDGREGANRRVRAHHALELPDQSGDVQGRAGAGGRMHDGAQAQRSVAALRADHCGDPSRSGRSGRRVQPGQRRRRDGGHAMAAHADVDMVSFTGSTRAGVAVAKAAADTVKRVAQELGGKSPNIVLPDADFDRAVSLGVARCFNNSGQSCVSPTRMLVPKDRIDGATADRAHRHRAHSRRHAVGRTFHARSGRQPIPVREGAAVHRSRDRRRRPRRHRRRRVVPTICRVASSCDRRCSSM